MSITESAASTSSRPLRMWPGIAATTAGWLAMVLVPRIAPQAAMYGVLAGVAGGLLVIVWWLFFSRAAWSERVGGVALIVVATFALRALVHESLAGAGMGMLVYIYAVPVLGLALVAGAAAGRRHARGPRGASIAASILVACAVLLLLRIDGISGRGGADWEWRWTPTVEERLLAAAKEAEAAAETVQVTARAAAPAEARGVESPAGGAVEPAAAPPEAEPVAGSELDPAAAAAGAPQRIGAEAAAADAAPASNDGAKEPAAAALDRPATSLTAPPPAPAQADWPGFRGARRDGIVHGVRIDTDWSQSPPRELWRRLVGPGWSSFAIQGDRFYTQEQLGEEELVSCYELETGEPVWRHRDRTRFWEANAGAGPRGTPTLHEGRLYTFGATGILNALDARDGSVAWSRNAAADTEVEVPYWGFSSSPIVVDDLVVVAAAGTLAAYDAADGELRWLGPEGKCCYSSPHLATIDGAPQILLLNGAGAISVSPADGALLWEHEWRGDGIVQPAVTEEGDVLIGTGSGMGGQTGIRRIAVRRGPGTPGASDVELGSSGWSVEERWTTSGLKPYFNDFVVHEGHAYGFDGGILAAIDLTDGRRRWKGGRYGDGQLVLLPEQDLLLVLSEKGELALVAATPGQFTEVARHPAIEGKTWNHPALAGDVVLVRNSEQMAAFRLPVTR